MNKALAGILQRSASGTAWGRLASGRMAGILVTFDGSHPYPHYVIKVAPSSGDADRLRNEHAALKYLAPWARQLGIPEVVEWQDGPEETCLVETGLPGRLASPGVHVGASREALRRRFQPPLAWIRQFQKTAPPPEKTPVRALAEALVDRLPRRPEWGGMRTFLASLAAEAPPGAMAVAVHGDFFVLNVLFAGSRVSVVDWDCFGPGFPLQDMLSFLANDGFYRTGHHCTFLEKYHHVFFSDSPVHELVEERVRELGLSEGELRFYFYFYLASQICAEKTVPLSELLPIVNYLERFGFPGPGVSLAPPG